VGVRFVRPVGELIRKSIVFAFLDSIQLFRRVRIRTIIGREHLAVIIPAKAVGIAQAAREDLDLWALGLRIEPPYASRQRHFAALIVAAIRAGLISIRARAAADVNKTIWTDGDMPNAMVKRSDAPRIRSPQPRLRIGRLALLDAAGAKNRDVVCDDGARFVTLISHDVESLLRVQREADGARAAQCPVNISAPMQDLFQQA